MRVQVTLYPSSFRAVRTVEDAYSVVGGDLQHEGVLEVLGAAAPAPQFAAGGVRAHRLQPPLQQLPVRRQPRRQLHLTPDGVEVPYWPLNHDLKGNLRKAQCRGWFSSNPTQLGFRVSF